MRGGCRLSGWLLRISSAPPIRRHFGAQAGIEYLFIAVVGGAGYVWGGYSALDFVV